MPTDAKVVRRVLRAGYSFVLYLLVPWVLLRLAWLGMRNPGYWRRWRERFGRVPVAYAGRRPVWIHAVSVGEVQVARALVERLRELRPGLDLLVTTTTPTGADLLAQTLGSSVRHLYFPYDLPHVIRRYLERIQPALVMLIETEIWPNLIAACGDRDIPVLLINGRLSARSYAGYRLGGELVRSAVAGLRGIAAQTAEDARRLVKLGAASAGVTVTGSIKFDARIPASLREQAEPLRRSLGVNRPVLIAASTHGGEEEQLLSAFARIRSTRPDALLLLVPRHPERGDAVAALVRARGLRCCRRSEGAINVGADVFLGDTLGELALFYAAADVAFVGGSLVPVGGHNLLEPAALGIPVLTGPHVFNFGEIVTLLERGGAVTLVRNAEELADRVSALFGDATRRIQAGEAGRAVVRANRGATQRVLEVVSPWLPRAPAALPVTRPAADP